MWPTYSLLVFVAAAIAILAAASRLVLAISRRFQLLLVLVALVLSLRALFLGEVLAPIDAAYRFAPLDGERQQRQVIPTSPEILGDVFLQMIPWRAAVRFALRHGEAPLWNPFIQSGDLLAGSMQAAPYFPTNLISLLVPLEDSFALVAGLNVLVATVCGFLFLRELRLRELSALFGGATWAYSSFLLFWLQWPLAQTISLLPLLLLAVRRVVRICDRASFLLLASSLLLVLLSGHPESMFHLTAIASAWGAIEVAVHERRRIARTFGLALLSGCVALGLAAFWIGPFLEALPQSTEHEMRQEVLAKSNRDRPFPEARLLLYPNIVPFVFGTYGVEESRMLYPFPLPSTGYCGSIGLIAAAYGAVFSRRRIRNLLAAAAAAGAILGSEMGPFAGWLANLPLFDIALNERLVFLCAFAISCLAALGLDAYLDRESRAAEAKLDVRDLAVLLASIAALACAVAVLWPGMRGIKLSENFLRSSSVLYLAPPLALLLLAAVPASRRHIPALLLPLLLLQRLGEMGHFHRSFPRDDFYPATPLVDVLKGNPEPFRFAGLGTAVRPNSAALWELEDVRGYQPMTLRRLIEARRLLGVERSIPTFSPVRIDFPFADFMNIRFAVVPKGLTGPEGWRVRHDGATATVFENPEVLPRARLPREIRLGSNRETLQAELFNADRFDQRAWIEPWDDTTPIETLSLENATGTVATRRLGTGYRLEALLDREGWITFAETAWRGWRASANGKDLPMGYANHAFLAIRAPAGRSEIDLRYSPDGFRWGLRISAATAVALVVFAWMNRRRQKSADLVSQRKPRRSSRANSFQVASS